MSSKPAHEQHKYHKTALFGGAITCDIPSNFADVSKIRQVPDNQEVFIDKDGFTTIIFDITQRVGAPPPSNAEEDAEALGLHLEDIVGAEQDTVRVWSTTSTQFSKMDSKVPAYTLLATQTPKGKADADFTAIILSLLRLESVRADILVTINVPHIKGEYNEEEIDLEMGRQGELIGQSVEFASQVWGSFDVKDWGLFGDNKDEL